jgi:hypothetical protein
LGRLGQSSQWHGQLLIGSALPLLNLQGKVLLGEYVGLEWLGALKRAGIDLVIGLPVSDYKVAMEG